MHTIRIGITAALAMIAVIIISAGCYTGNVAVINEVIDTQSTHNMINNNRNNPDFVIVDVRTQNEFNEGHIAEAIMIDMYSADFRDKISALDRNKKYLVYCRTARRSAAAAKMMKEMGFREVYDMAGGINQWKTDGFPVVTH